MRIISGFLKGRKLIAPKGLLTRPSSDKIKESIFNILSYNVKNKVVLDLFAGSGALGIEALSRGADCASFIDNDKKALESINANILKCAIETKTKVIKWNILLNLKCLKKQVRKFNLVFMDPPYNKNYIIKTFKNLHNSLVLASSAIIVLEHSYLEKLDSDQKVFVLEDQREYNKTTVSFFKYNN